MKKLEIDIITLISLKQELLDRYGVVVKVRNYFFSETPDPYFIFERKPRKKVKLFVIEYFSKIGGSVIFTSDNMSFVVLE